MIEEKHFIEVPGGEHFIGLDRTVLGKLGGSLLQREVRIDYLENSVPRHAVQLERVHVSRRMVSRGDFGAFIEETGFITEAERDGWGWTWRDGWVKAAGLTWRFPFGDDADELYREYPDDMPVLQSSWNDAMEYCRWLSGRTGRCVRLPREAESETVSGSIGSAPLEEILSDPPPEIPRFTTNREFVMCLIRSLENRETHNAGLLWEWNDDWFDIYPGGRPNREFGHVYKVLRGGSLMSHPVQRCREYRFRRCPTARSPFYGFRTALE